MIITIKTHEIHKWNFIPKSGMIGSTLIKLRNKVKT
jgi:hypothetical protein